MADAPDIVYATRSIKVKTSEGTLFVHVMENENGLPFEILVNIGKSGSSLAAWADAVARLVSAILPVRGISGAIELLSGITSQQLYQSQSGEVVRSGPEGLAIALLKYTAEWHRERRPKPRPGGPTLNS